MGDAVGEVPATVPCLGRAGAVPVPTGVHGLEVALDEDLEGGGGCDNGADEDLDGCPAPNFVRVPGCVIGLVEEAVDVDDAEDAGKAEEEADCEDCSHGYFLPAGDVHASEEDCW